MKLKQFWELGQNSLIVSLYPCISIVYCIISCIFPAYHTQFPHSWLQWPILPPIFVDSIQFSEFRISLPYHHSHFFWVVYIPREGIHHIKWRGHRWRRRLGCLAILPSISDGGGGEKRIGAVAPSGNTPEVATGEGFNSIMHHVLYTYIIYNIYTIIYII